VIKMGFKKLAFFLFLIVLISGCIPDYRIHPEFEMRSKNIKTFGLITPDIKIYKLTTGGVRELVDDWSDKGKENVLNVFVRLSRGRGIDVRPIKIEQDIEEEEVEDIKSLYMAVSKSILLHTYNIPSIDEPFYNWQEYHGFPDKIKNFVYSIGPVEKITQKYGVDALIFIYGIDEIPTEGRKALTAAGVLLTFATGVNVMPRPAITALSVAVVDPSGTILWYCAKTSETGTDLRESLGTEMLIDNILSDFPWSRSTQK
jgi:hypothetical protein